MSTIIAVTGRKGGVGKSTITGNLAGELIAAGKTVRVLDTDPQRSLMAWASLGGGVLSLVASAIETEHPERFQAAVERAGREADVVLIDTPPGFADPALLASLLADIVLLPSGPSPLDVLAARDALALVQEAQARRGGRPLAMFVPSRVISRAVLSQDLPGTLATLGAPVLPGIAQRTAIAEAALSGLTIAEFQRSGPARSEFQTLAAKLMELLM